MQPYKGLLVLDAAQGIAGPYCGMLLAAMGADVIKLEPPKGDWSRGLGTRQGDHSVMSTVFNRGKRGVVLDMATEDGKRQVQALAAKADVVIEAFRPGVAARIGLGPEHCKADVVYASVSGFGQKGPHTERPCTDSVMQAFSGFAALNKGMDDVPHRAYTTPIDIHTGMCTFAAVQAALADRLAEGARGGAPRQRILDCSLMAGAASLLSIQVADVGLLGRQPPELNVPAGSYACADGAWVMVALVREQEWVDLVTLMGAPHLLEDPRFADFPARAANKSALLPLLREIFLTRSCEEWLALFRTKRLLTDRMNTPLEWLAEPHVKEVNAAPLLDQPGLGPVPMVALPGIGPILSPSPGLGQHTDAVLAEHGLKESAA